MSMRPIILIRYFVVDINVASIVKTAIGKQIRELEDS
jgi:uncharacterized protein with HEPN domain